MRALNALGVLVAGSFTLGSRGGCNEGENAFIMGQMHLVTTDGTPGPAGSTCSDVSAGSGSSSGGTSTDDFWMREESTSKGLLVEIGSFEQLLEQRFYDRPFIAAHEVDRFTVTTRSGDRYAFVYWGGDSCESCPPRSFEALPGDIWGCPSVP